MIFLRQLAKAELVALTALVIAGAALAGFAAVQASVATASVLGVGGSAKVVFLYTFFIGSVPAVLFGAPLYSVLHHFNKVSWPIALGIGIAPGAGLMLVAIELGLWAFVCGAFVAGVTHAVCGPGANNSFKPNPFHRFVQLCRRRGSIG